MGLRFKICSFTELEFALARCLEALSSGVKLNFDLGFFGNPCSLNFDS